VRLVNRFGVGLEIGQNPMSSLEVVHRPLAASPTVERIPKSDANHPDEASQCIVPVKYRI
jgi:hypothetical protein